MRRKHGTDPDGVSDYGIVSLAVEIGKGAALKHKHKLSLKQCILRVLNKTLKEKDKNDKEQNRHKPSQVFCLRVHGI